MAHLKKSSELNIREYAHHDWVDVLQNRNDMEIVFGGDQCRKMLLNQQEALVFLLKIYKQADLLWGDSFTGDFKSYADKL